ncbi:MAG: NHL repeat-containing protein [Candidatus Omnitrophica bacterium]|nr:NHL repeat-containing protein [Candidatus Omnitrophota bacterium]MCB9768326.1 NHL repeat-containing protein [Candidatus Omnitrophota bacterium]
MMEKDNLISRKSFLNFVAIGTGSLVAGDVLFDYEAAWCKEVETPKRLELDQAIPTRMDTVRGLAFDSEDRLHIAGSGGVVIADTDGSVIREFSPKGLISGITVDEDGSMFLCHATRVQHLDPEGKQVTLWGEAGKERGQFGYLTGIALSGAMLYLADAGNRRITRYAINGDYVDEIDGFSIPSAYFDCGIDGKGDLYVGHTSKHQVEKYDGNHELVEVWGEYGSDPEKFCGCCNPTHIAVYPDGNVATTEKGIPRLKVYGPYGNLLAYLSPEQLGLSPDPHFLKQLQENSDGSLPCHDGWPGMPLAVSKNLRLAVAIPGTGEIKIYRMDG